MYVVSTAGHGGVMVPVDLAEKYFRPAALAPEILDRFNSRTGSWYCFEEDCGWCVPVIELLNNPKTTFNFISPWCKGDRKKTLEIAKKSASTWYPEYYKAIAKEEPEQVANPEPDQGGLKLVAPWLREGVRPCS